VSEKKAQVGNYVAGAAFGLIGLGLVGGGIGSLFISSMQHFSAPLIVAGLVCGLVGALGIRAAARR
jgi:hypothetical protein